MRLGQRQAGIARRLACALWAALTLMPLTAAAQRLALQDLGELQEGQGESTLRWAGRVETEGDQLMGTDLADVPTRSVVRLTVQTLADPRWVLHELEGAFRDPRRAGFQKGTRIEDRGERRRIEQSLAFAEKTWRIVAWPTGRGRVVSLTFSLKGPDRWSEMPTQLVDTYLARYPSTLPTSVEDTPEHHVAWIRDEMSRLPEYAQRDLGHARGMGQDPSPADWRDHARDLLQSFAAMQSTFYGAGGGGEAFASAAEASDRRSVEGDGSLDEAKQQAWLQARLEESKGWWAAHRNDPVRLPAAPPPSGAPPTSPSARTPRGDG